MSQISTKAEIGENVSICPSSIIYDNVVIKNNSIIDSFCKIGVPSSSERNMPLVIGANSHIRSHSIFYDNSTFEKNLVTGHHVLVRDKIKAGKFLQIGSFSEFEGNSSIGHYVKIHSRVHLPRLTKIGDLVYLFPRVQGSDDPLPPSNIAEPITIKSLAVICINSLIMPDVTIGMGSFVAAASVVKDDVPDGYCVAGNPAKVFTRIDRLINFEHKIRHPWPLHNNRKKYPEESYGMIDQYLKEIDQSLDK